VRAKVHRTPAESAEALRRLRRRYAERHPNLLDGILIEFENSWVHVRRSNTEPVLRVTAEAPTEAEAAALAARLVSEIAGA